MYFLKTGMASVVNPVAILKWIAMVPHAAVASRRQGEKANVESAPGLLATVKSTRR